MGCGLKKEKKDINNEIIFLKPLIKFKIIFSNIKIKNITLKKTKVHFSIANQECFQTQISYNNSNPHWRQTFRSIHESDLETLKLEFFKISVFCAEKNKCFAYVIQNMWEVANGPIHYDLFLESTKANSSRITFDLRMVQMTTLKIQSKQVICELKDQLMEQAYNFQLKVRSHQVDYYSDFSPNYLNHYLYRQSSIKQYGYIDSKEKLRSESDEFQLVRDIFDSSQDENIQTDLKSCYLKKNGLKNDQDLILKKSKSNNQPSTMIHLSTNQSQTNKSLNQRKPYSTMDLITKKDLLWEFKVQENNPIISFDIYVDSFSSSSFEFILWGSSKPNEKSDNVSVRKIGNSVISLNKFFSQNVNVLAELDRISLQEVIFTDKLWIHGQCVGRVKAEFIITKDTFIRQMLGGFRTEEGIQRSSLLYIKKDKYSGPQSPNINQIIQINNEIDELAGKLNQKSLQHRERVKINKAINQIIEKLSTLIKNQELYENLEEMIAAQLVFVDLTKNLLESADLIDEDLRDQYYNVLITLLNRDEFFISYLGFDKDLKEAYLLRNDQNYVSKNKKLIQQLNQKIRIGLHYQNFLHQTFEKVAQKLNQQGQNDKEELFVNAFLVIAFFRIPQFQKLIIDILKQDQRLLNEEFEKDFGINCIDNTFSAEWDKNFYDYLQSDPRHQEHKKQLQDILNTIDWKNIILTSRVFLKWFQLMLNHYKKAKHPYDMSLTWSGFPGYLILIKYLLLEIKYSNEYPYPETIKHASLCILENENMLNYLVIVIFHKTKLYDGIAVFYTLDMINEWFQIIKKQNKKIPTDYNYQFLMKGLFMIFDGQHASSISKALQLIFNIFPQMPIEIQKEISDHIFDNCFFKFFMFWSKLVRFVFQHFLIYRIQHRLRNYRQESIRDIYKEFECIKLQKQKYTVEEKAKLLNHLIYIRYSQMIELVLKIKRKIAQHNLQQESQFQLQLETKSLKLKLMKKKQKQKKYQYQQQKRMESPRHDQIDISFEKQQRSNISLTFSLNDPFYSSDIREDEKSIDQSHENGKENNISNYDQNEIYLFDRSISSIINLNDLLADIDQDKKINEKRKSRHSNRNNSVELNSEKSQKSRINDNENPKKLKIYHRISKQENIKKSFTKELLSYLFPAIQEWQEQQANYKRWFLKNQTIIKKQYKQDQQEQQLMDIDPPEINLYVPKDETENENVYTDH
ncbi:unnamed protein product [Paramecium primaurelia]|uniref:C2 domain-containing protein n=1 Tax=Paramecium primaurelia TaxID=5886 RepID=A0A8S1LKW6_PARPR|nr:unnamed protein product [Paramecium primaurelia]